MATTPQGQSDQEEEVLTQDPAKVVLFNDEVHTFDEVIVQLIKATRCPRARAEALACEVHSRGKAIVFSGEVVRCMEVSGILEEIHLLTQIEM
jgi:ATP-dependent Clp protease adaptor protein ClpS